MAAGPTTDRKRFAQIVGGTGAVIAVLVGITSLITWGKGMLGDGTPPPASIDARIVDIQPQGDNETLRDYIRSIKLTQGPRYTAEQLAEHGYVFAVRVRIKGAQGEKLPLRWSFHEARRGHLSGPVYNQIGVMFAPRARDHARTWPVWLPHPPQDGRYRARFTLEDPEGLPVDTQDTPLLQRPRAQE